MTSVHFHLKSTDSWPFITFFFSFYWSSPALLLLSRAITCSKWRSFRFVCTYTEDFPSNIKQNETIKARKGHVNAINADDPFANEHQLTFHSTANLFNISTKNFCHKMLFRLWTILTSFFLLTITQCEVNSWKIPSFERVHQFCWKYFIIKFITLYK